jgi:hypothetical protein
MCLETSNLKLYNLFVFSLLCVLLCITYYGLSSRIRSELALRTLKQSLHLPTARSFVKHQCLFILTGLLPSHLHSCFLELMVRTLAYGDQTLSSTTLSATGCNLVELVERKPAYNVSYS